MARMGDWRDNKDIEIPLDGIGGVNILVKADVHRSGKHTTNTQHPLATFTNHDWQASISPATPSKTKPRPKVSPKWPNERVTAFTVCRIMSFGILIPRRSRVMRKSERSGEKLRCFWRFDLVHVMHVLWKKAAEAAMALSREDAHGV